MGGRWVLWVVGWFEVWRGRIGVFCLVVVVVVVNGAAVSVLVLEVAVAVAVGDCGY
jgi:hypothetical protein